jgi:hypothetical protein
VYGELEKEAELAGEASSVVTGRGEKSGIESPKAMRRGRVRVKKGVGRLSVWRSMLVRFLGTISRRGGAFNRRNWGPCFRHCPVAFVMMSLSMSTELHKGLQCFPRFWSGCVGDPGAQNTLTKFLRSIFFASTPIRALADVHGKGPSMEMACLDKYYHSA